MKTVKATIDAAGKVVIEVDGVRGRQCLDLTRDIERSLGRVSDRINKGDMFRHEEVRHGQPARGG